MTTRRDFFAALTLAGTGRILWPSSPAMADQVSGPTASTAIWRTHFPALGYQVNGKPLVYLDNAATTHKPRSVLDAELSYYWQANANPATSLHELARRAADRYEGARRAVAGFLNAWDPAELIFCRGTTEAINLVASAWGGANLKSGDEVLLSEAEHYSNLLPWQHIAQRTGAVIRFVPTDADGRILIEQLSERLSQRTRIVSISHVSNVFGLIQPVAEIARLVRTHGALFFVDGAQSAPHIPIDVRALGCDFFALSAHKMAGPMGVGALWARRELLDSMPPYQLGGHMAKRVEFQKAEYVSGAHRFEAGSPNIAGPVAWAAALEFTRRLGAERIWQRHQELVRHALQRLKAVPGLHIFGTPSPTDRVGIISFYIDGRDPVALAKQLDRRGIAIRAGDLAAGPLLRSRGHDTLARVSLYLYNEPREIDFLVESLERAVA